MLKMSNKRLIIMLGLCGCCLLLLPILSLPANAQDSAVDLREAIKSGTVTVKHIVGNSPDGRMYRQPLLTIQMQNTTASPIEVMLPMGSEVTPTDNPDANPSMVIVGFARGTISLAGNESVNEGIFAFSKEIQRYPTNSVTYAFASQQQTTNQDLQPLLQHIKHQGGVGNSVLDHQIAVWRVATNADCQTVSTAIQSTFQADMDCASNLAQRVQTLLDESSSNTNPSPSNDTDNDNSRDNTSREAGSMLTTLGIVFGVIVLGLAAYFGYTIWSSKQKQTSASGTASASQTPNPKHNPHQPVSHTPPFGDRGNGGGGMGGRQTGIGAGRDFDSPTGPMNKPDSSSSSTISSSNGTTNSTQAEPQTQKPETQSAQEQQPPRSASETTPRPLQDKKRSGTETTPMPPHTGKVLSHSLLPDELITPRVQFINLAQPQIPPLLIKSETLLCRGTMNQCIIENDNYSISIPHCVIRFISDRQSWMIKDLASRNGTYMQGQPVLGSNIPLPHQAQLRFGSVSFQFEGASDGSAATLSQHDAHNKLIEYSFDPNKGAYWLITAGELACLDVSNGDPSVSAPHAFIRFKDGWKIRDLNSASGTWIKRMGIHNEQQEASYRIESVPRRIDMQDVLYLSKTVSYRCEPISLPNIGTYRLTQWIGHGSIASVFLATSTTDNDSHSPKVVKLLKDSSATEKFKDECALLNKLTSAEAPELIRYETHGQDATYGWYLVMEYIHGATLESILRSRQQQGLKETAVIAIASSIGKALVYLHAEEWVHCDLKPENILIDRSGRVCLADFGAITRVGKEATFFTENYAPPEFLASHQAKIAEPTSDIYSLGLVMYEMLHGSYYQPKKLGDRPKQKPDNQPKQKPSKPDNRMFIFETVPLSKPNTRHEPTQSSTTPRSHRSYPAKNDLDTVIKRCLREVEPYYASTDELLGDLRKIDSEKIDYASTLAHLVHNVDVFAQEGSTTHDTIA